MSNNLDLLKTTFSGNPSIDGLIWPEHFTYAAEYPFKNYINFSFDPSVIADPTAKNGSAALTDTAKQAVRNSLNMIKGITGINFNEVADGVATNTDMVFAKKSFGNTVPAQDVYTYTFNPAAAVQLDISDTILLNSDNYGIDSIPSGTPPYLGLLHELGHALGMRDPDSTPGAYVRFPEQYNNGGGTIMASTNTNNYNYTTLDVQALNWIYGGKGLTNPGIVPSGDASSNSWTVYLTQNGFLASS